MVLLAFASRLLAPNYLDHLLRSILPRERFTIESHASWCRVTALHWVPGMFISFSFVFFRQL